VAAPTDQGEVRCWGANDDGQLGYGNTVQIGDNEPPAQVGYVQTGDGVVQIEAGGHHTCARYDDGTLRCWGNGAMGQLGYGNTNFIGNNELPNSVGTVDVGGFVHDVMCKLEETCALLDGGEIRCWGAGNFGQLGYGNTLNIGNDELPSSVGVVQVGAAVATLTESTAQFHVCVLTTANNIRCWGNGADGRLGYGNVNNVGNNEVPSFVGDVPY
jgi:alpha-tubulin suppressor-like RCC1 family protein